MEPLDFKKNTVFLAGPCPRDPAVGDWRGEFIALLDAKAKESNVQIDILNPTNRNFDDANYVKQCDWEHEGLAMASVIVFWVPRTEKNPAFTTNVEFGEWFQSGKCICGGPKDGWKNRYLEQRFNGTGQKWFYSIEEIVNQIVARFSRQPKSWFTSDTHFSEEKKIKTARRPFRDRYHMDWTIVSNWNKKINSNDTVYHCGDFVNPNAIKYLNFGKLVLVRGNHDTEKVCQKILELGNGRVEICNQKELTINDRKYTLIHEPLFDRVATPLEQSVVIEEPFYLFGHIHRASGIKRNGINVGVDINNYSPLSVQDIEYIRDGVEDYADEDDFTEICRELRDHGDVVHE
jgi:calcineurin-like phosphoesterase family protein